MPGFLFGPRRRPRQGPPRRAVARLRRQPEAVGRRGVEERHGSQGGGICEAGGGDL